MKNKIISFVFAFLLIFSMLSCSQKNETVNDNNNIEEMEELEAVDDLQEVQDFQESMESFESLTEIVSELDSLKNQAEDVSESEISK